ncbi:hypothetical protein HWV62_45555 [Athelia sp. TMB]|nr:hypothetical protein HWV62_45555 [Athelia sp. TMB]
MHAPDYIVLTLHRLSNSASSDLGLGLSGLICLRFDVGYLPADLLVAISECCPELKELYVGASPGKIGARTGRELRRSSHTGILEQCLLKTPPLLPPKLQIFALSFDYYPAERRSITTWTGHVKHHLFRTMANLKDLHLKFNLALDMHWKKKDDGRGFIEDDACSVCRVGEGLELYTIPL